MGSPALASQLTPTGYNRLFHLREGSTQSGCRCLPAQSVSARTNDYCPFAGFPSSPSGQVPGESGHLETISKRLIAFSTASLHHLFTLTLTLSLKGEGSFEIVTYRCFQDCQLPQIREVSNLSRDASGQP